MKNRLTVSVLFGVDNQFSGTMIKETTGQTVGGAPINLAEATYDEVYGRIGMWKVGVGYRTTPRTEAGCRTWTGWSKKACGVSTARARAGRSRSWPACESGSETT